MNIGMNNVGYLQQQQYDVQTKLTNTDSHSNQYLSPQTSQTNLDESSDFLVFTLDKTKISLCSYMEL